MTLQRYDGRQFAGLILAALLLSGCSVRRFAVARVGDALASGGSVYESDEDIELVGGALPFGLKMVESLLQQVPKHQGLLQTACQGFATYGYAYVQNEADQKEDTDLQQAAALRRRARRLYLRARVYGLRGLDAAYPGLTARLDADPKSALAAVSKKKYVPLLYWNAVALGLAISANKNDTATLARIPEVEAFIERALQLDEAWSEGTLHEFQVSFASSKPGGADERALSEHYRRALELSGGKRAGLYVAYAEAVWLPKQNKAEFTALLDRALALDPDLHEAQRLPNALAQRRAKWLLGKIDDLILETKEEPK